MKDDEAVEGVLETLEGDLPTYIDPKGRERNFPLAFVESVDYMTHNGVTAGEAARKLGHSTKTVYYHLRSQAGSKYLTEVTATMLGEATGQALAVMTGLLSSESENVRYRAAKALLDVGITNASRPSASAGGSLTVNIDI